MEPFLFVIKKAVLKGLPWLALVSILLLLIIRMPTVNTVWAQKISLSGSVQTHHWITPTLTATQTPTLTLTVTATPTPTSTALTPLDLPILIQETATAVNGEPEFTPTLLPPLATEAPTAAPTDLPLEEATSLPEPPPTAVPPPAEELPTLAPVDAPEPPAVP